MKEKLIAEIIELLKNPTYENVELVDAYIGCLRTMVRVQNDKRKS